MASGFKHAMQYVVVRNFTVFFAIVFQISRNTLFFGLKFSLYGRSKYTEFSTLYLQKAGKRKLPIAYWSVCKKSIMVCNVMLALGLFSNSPPYKLTIIFCHRTKVNAPNLLTHLHPHTSTETSSILRLLTSMRIFNYLKKHNTSAWNLSK